MSVSGMMGYGIADLFLGFNFLLGYSSVSLEASSPGFIINSKCRFCGVTSGVKDYVTSSPTSLIHD